MHAACCEAHPDESHYLRRHIRSISAHCMRVTAAVSLSNAGYTTDVIAHRLRWSSDAVELYLRDCWRNIGSYTTDALRCAYED